MFKLYGVSDTRKQKKTKLLMKTTNKNNKRKPKWITKKELCFDEEKKRMNAFRGWMVE